MKKLNIAKEYVQGLFKVCLLFSLLFCLSACGDNSEQKAVEPIQSESLSTQDVMNAIETEEADNTPTKDEVLAMRDSVTSGMSDEEISRMTENIKVANIAMENAYMYDSLFERLADPEDMYWNYIEQKGEIQIGWELEDVMDYDSSEGLTYKEYAEKYGEPVITYNRFDADNFIILMTEMRDSLKTDLLKSDFDNLVQNMQLAKDTHDVEYVKNIYYILHDMDYFLFRYGVEDVGEYMKDKSTVGKYYDSLDIYSN